MSLYQELIRPIEHRGGNEPVTAAEIRNCLSRVAEALQGFEGVTGTAVGDDGPALTPADEADTE